MGIRNKKSANIETDKPELLGISKIAKMAGKEKYGICYEYRYRQ